MILVAVIVAFAKFPCALPGRSLSWTTLKNFCLLSRLHDLTTRLALTLVLICFDAFC